MPNPLTPDDSPDRSFVKPAPVLSLADLREEYWRGGLSEQQCDPNPILQFERWMQNAQAANLHEPNAMILGTASAAGRPSARVVLLKEVSDAGFVFYTNYHSRKAQDLEANPFAALTFYWPELGRQVRVEGGVRRVSREQSQAYFSTRPKGSRLGAWASHQSEVLPSRDPLDRKWEQLQQRYAEIDDVPTPEFWGGYCVIPEGIEFWQGRPNRLHDRLRYRRNAEHSWTIERLSP
jgi:pyridoxamine 5'-phosphate oxidase